ncbi:histone-lysine N-methyltransferase, H3 lysine-9 specific SUVH6-like [Euphorbia lathyris]|uniref:histone-lysine N-methyltransferase, H3 lysine-9 specific SUVH6-like n=1 Tax=Euphorbia lathyris TaxID=212925 RepID=UPI003313A7F1
MGFVDNTLQRESTKVVIISNSQGKLGRLPMENGHQDARGGLQYKWRSVSAVRDFPPGCGPRAPRISLEPKDEAVCINTVENSGDLVRNGDAEGDGLISSRSGIDSQPPRALENLGPAIIPGHMNHAESKVEAHLIPSGNGIDSQPAKALENTGSTEIPRQSDSLESKVEAPVAPAELENGNPVNIEPVQVSFPGVPDSLSNSGDIEQLKSLEHETLNVPNILHKKDVPISGDHIFPLKYPPRRKISAVRDFPPFCGRNAAPLIHENADVLASTDGESWGQELMNNKDAQNGDNVLKKMGDSVKVLEAIGLDIASNCPIVLGLAAAGTGPWMGMKNPHKPNELSGRMIESKQTKSLILQEHPNASLKAKQNDVENSGGVRIKAKKKKKKNLLSGGQAYQFMENIAQGVEDKREHVGESDNLQLVRRSQNFDVTLPPCPIRSSGKSDANDASVTRSKVRETLRLYHAVYRKVVKEEETKSKNSKRPDLVAAGILKEKGKFVNLNKIIGPVPGVEVGDEFQYRVELHIIGLHRPMQGGIDSAKDKEDKERIIAISIVASGGYDDNMDDSDVLIYTGSGGNVMNGKKEPEDQKLERGNLALKNSADTKNPVRVIRGDMRVSESTSAKTKIYVYDGLYLVEQCWQELGPHEKLIFKFKLVRIPGQPELAWKVIKKCKKFKIREGLCVDDISKGKEIIPICAVNMVDEEKPPPFEYIKRVIYPKRFGPVPPRGCDCTQECSETGKCSCVAKNGGQIPYNRNGAIVEAKSLVYECGPSCKCPPSCYNKVSQHGIKFQLEIFKTESRGWGVRSLNSISSGSFICEYVGELLEDKEAEERKGNDEYLFDIGNSYTDGSLWDGFSNLVPETHENSNEMLEESSFTIDAAKYGNVGRFINHSCSPNLYAQNVLYDHGDKRVPHIMLFAAENIPPLQELTYHYNYTIDQVHDSDGSIKKKECYCGSSECTGRLY